ncbi:MAG: MBL fold metallo-hydrolase [Gammaproteobacteria bacterium]|nr:MBL fold metallo-hydrolase [Gammaproteobacteria bacterium]
MKITLLGTGTPTPSLRRMSAGYLVETGDAVMLFDFGPGCYHRMMEAGVRAVDVTHVFFTHLHYDHCLDFVRLLMTRWDQGGGRIDELNVFGPAHTQQLVDSIISPQGLFGPDIAARTQLPMSQAVHVARGGTLPRQRPAPVVRELKSGGQVDGDGWTVSVRAVRHAQPVLECFGYRLEQGGHSFAYSGDSGPCKAMELLAEDCDVLVHMCHFISGTELNEAMAQNNMGHLDLARLGQSSGAKNVVISHVTEQMDVPGVRERILREMGEIYTGNLFFGEDLMVVPVNGPTPLRLD